MDHDRIRVGPSLSRTELPAPLRGQCLNQSCAKLLWQHGCARVPSNPRSVLGRAVRNFRQQMGGSHCPSGIGPFVIEAEPAQSWPRPKGGSMTSEPKPSPNAARLERTYDAPAELIWELCTTAAGLEQWWGPDGFETEVSELELSPSGHVRYTMTATAPDQVAFVQNLGMPLST